jgi:hypothetical protein
MADTDEKKVAGIDTRSLLLILALFGGGGVGGGVVSAVQGSAVPQSISADLKGLGEKVQDLRVTIERMEGAARGDRASTDRLEKDLERLERRVDALEARKPAPR